MFTLLVLYYFMWYMLVLMVVLFVLSGLDDFFVDGFFWYQFIGQRNLDYSQLGPIDEACEQAIAVLIPCWHEENIIARMLKNNHATIHYANAHFFVGVYPNDRGTVDAVARVAAEHPRVHCVVGATPGPTTKAANLNQVYAYVKAFERDQGPRFDVFVFHDSEDLIHPLSFKLYNHFIPAHDMVQIPVFPLEVAFKEWTHWVYADEFAETHTKNIFVRQSINAHIPSAGVGTGFSRQALAALEDPDTGHPFSVTTLTEDYRTSLALRLRGFKSTFVFVRVLRKRWVKVGLWGRRWALKTVKEVIATRAFFPRDYLSSVRQKSRWIIGIIFQEWDHVQWPKEWPLRYSLMNDRKGFLTHLINMISYVVFFFWLIFSQLAWHFPDYPSLQEQLNLHGLARVMMAVVGVIMLERNMQRMIATYRIYGWRPLWGVIPRIFYGNVLNCHALLRAYRVYFSTPKQKNAPRQPVWDKTDHDFPGRHPLLDYRQSFSQMLLSQHLLSTAQLQAARQRCYQTGARLGEVLCALGYLDASQVVHVLARQHDLTLVKRADCMAVHDLPRGVLVTLRRMLRQGQLAVVSLDVVTMKITLAIKDPTHVLLINQCIARLRPYSIQFCMLV